MLMSPKSPLLFSLRAISRQDLQFSETEDQESNTVTLLTQGKTDPDFGGAMAQNNGFFVTLANMLEDFRCRVFHC